MPKDCVSEEVQKPELDQFSPKGELLQQPVVDEIRVRPIDPHMLATQEKLRTAVAMSIVDALPPSLKGSDATVSALITKIMVGELSAWVVVQNGTINLVGIIVCGTSYQPMTDRKVCTIYTFRAYAKITESAMANALAETVTPFAKGRGCTHIEFFTQSEKLISVGRLAGFDTWYRMIKEI